MIRRLTLIGLRAWPGLVLLGCVAAVAYVVGHVHGYSLRARDEERWPWMRGTWEVQP